LGDEHSCELQPPFQKVRTEHHSARMMLVTRPGDPNYCELPTVVRYFV